MYHISSVFFFVCVFRYPNASCILDFVRCSATFDSVGALYATLNSFIKYVTQDKRSRIIIDIVRVKNGFNQVLNWQNSRDCGYCDLKLNVIIYNKDTKRSTIGEIQFLLKWLLKAKKMGHKLYGIKRRSQFIQSNANLVYNVDGDYDKYKTKVNKLIDGGDFEGIGNELILQPNLILSIIRRNALPLLHFCYNFKLHQLFLSNIFYFGEVVLNESIDKDKDKGDSNGDSNSKSKSKETLFISKYLNFNRCDDEVLMTFNRFWGINANNILSRKDGHYKSIETIMKSKYFNGLSQMSKNWNRELLMPMCKFNRFYYFELIVKYWEKNVLMIKNGMETRVNGALLVLLKGNHCNQEWVKLFFKAAQLSGAVFTDSVLNQAIEYCEGQGEKKQFVPMIQEYIDVTKKNQDHQDDDAQ